MGLQERQVDRNDPVRGQGTGDNVGAAGAAVLRLLLQRQPGAHALTLPRSVDGAPSRRVLHAKDAALQRLRRPGRPALCGNGPEKILLMASRRSPYVRPSVTIDVFAAMATYWWPLAWYVIPVARLALPSGTFTS